MLYLSLRPSGLGGDTKKIHNLTRIPLVFVGSSRCEAFMGSVVVGGSLVYMNTNQHRWEYFLIYIRTTSNKFGARTGSNQCEARTQKTSYPPASRETFRVSTTRDGGIPRDPKLAHTSSTLVASSVERLTI